MGGKSSKMSKMEQKKRLKAGKPLPKENGINIVKNHETGKL